MPILGLPANLPPPYPSHFDIESIIRPNILALQPYRCARDDYQDGILLDANENALGHSISTSSSTDASPDALDGSIASALTLPLHRYPSPSHIPIKSLISSLRSLPSPEHVFLGVGSDEVLDLLIRVFVAPGGNEKIIITPPTYGMYSVCAQVNDVGILKVPLVLNGDGGEGGRNGRFSLDVAAVKQAIENESDPKNVKLIFLCSPGNPTGTLISLDSIKEILEFEKFKGVVVVDEAYIDFAEAKDSAASLITRYSNLCVVQTLSKSFGLAAIRLGIALSQLPLIQILTNTKAPYNISTPTAHLALSALSPSSLILMRSNVNTIKANRSKLAQELAKIKNEDKQLGVGEIIGGNDANFVLVRILEKPSTTITNGNANVKVSVPLLKPSSSRANRVYRTLAEEMGVVVRYRGNEAGCEGCIRITVGTEEEGTVVLEKLREILAVL